MDTLDSGYQTKTYEAIPEEPGQKKRATWSILSSLAIHSVTVASTFLVLTLLKPPPPKGIVEFESVVFSEDDSPQIGDPNSSVDKSDIDVDETNKEVHQKQTEIKESNIDVKKTMDSAETDVLEETETAVEKSGAEVRVAERAADAMLDKTLSQEKARSGALAKEINAREKAAAARMIQRGARLKMPGKNTDGSSLFSKIGNKNLTLIIDTSGSMGAILPIEGGGSIQALDYVKLELAGLIRRQISRRSRFNIITFSSDTKVWQPKLVKANSKNKKSALAFLQMQAAGGGTNLLDALVEAFKDKKTEAVLVLTDGEPSRAPEYILEEVARMNKRRKVTIHTVAFIVGARPREFLRKLAMQNGGVPKAFP